MVKVKINSKNNILLFSRMNAAIVDGYQSAGRIPNTGEHRQRFEQTYGVKIIRTEGSHVWTHIEFPDEQSYTMAVLKWM